MLSVLALFLAEHTLITFLLFDYANAELIEFVVRRKLHDEGEALLGLFPGNPQRATARPTTERILSAFKSLSFTLFSVRGEQYGHVSPLNPLQLKLLHLLGLPSDIYSSLAASPA